MARIGLVAAQGRLPMVFAKLAKQKGDTVIAFALKDAAAPELSDYVDKIHWLEWGQMEKALLLLAAERVRKIIMLGKIKKEIFFKEGQKLDDKARSIVDKLSDKNDYSILNGVKNFLGKFGVEVIESTAYLKELIPQKGTLTKRGPTAGEWEDINYGKDVGKALSGYDIGQTVAIKDKTVIAVEGMEGTDETISRAGSLIKGAFVVVKVARPNQDMRFDVPLVGPSTLKALIDAGASALALEADKTLIMDREELIRLADEKSISVVAI